ncbi:hypothetical protein CEXT_35481 [Caerostris extrusa]|uniref:Reverse transcriptase n=1 Tax=Caerostris extrusa TaxID=172846 RepID=A0AAV4UH91_CAEEX|nr:hypothetical protein CEXT_35481 [Caerostris extrusa]
MSTNLAPIALNVRMKTPRRNFRVTRPEKNTREVEKRYLARLKSGLIGWWERWQKLFTLYSPYWTVFNPIKRRFSDASELTLQSFPA